MATITDKKTGEEIEANNPFFQFYKHNIKLMRKLVTDNPLAGRLFFLLVETMDNSNALVISQSNLTEMLECGRTSLYKATKYLIEKKYMHVYRTGPSLVYCVNADIVWTQRADKKMFAKFDVKVYLTNTEQDEEVQKRIETEYLKMAQVEEQTPKQLRTEEKEAS
jgi:hypothetical protein